jgi:transposase
VNLHAHVAKEELRTLLTLFGTHPERHLPRRALHSIYASATASGAPEIHPLATTIETWRPAIEATILTGHTNTRSQGYNRLAKHEGRNASGLRNPTNQRHHIRRACTPNTGKCQSPPPSYPVKCDEPVNGQEVKPIQR